VLDPVLSAEESACLAGVDTSPLEADASLGEVDAYLDEVDASLAGGTWGQVARRPS
jgi:hypothetical protein